MKKNRKIFGFIRERAGRTLVEVMVVITVIGLITSFVLTSITDTRKKARDDKRISDINQIDMAIKMYAQFNNGNAIGVPGWYAQVNNTCAGWYVGGKPVAEALKPFLNKVPDDPMRPAPPTACTISNHFWYYYGNGFRYILPEESNTPFGLIESTLNPKDYIICSKLERKADVRIDVPNPWGYVQYCVNGARR